MLDIEEKNKQHYKLQRIVIGICGILLVPLSLIFGILGEYFGNNFIPHWMNNISLTFWATSNVLMISALAISGMFLITYLSLSKKDEWINRIIGIGFFGIIAFPYLDNNLLSNIGLFQVPCMISNILHASFAFISFALMGYNCIFLFTISRDNLTKKKKIRNIIYIICGIGIWLFLIMIGFYTVFKLTNMAVMWYEWSILTLFGLSWIIKSGLVGALND